MNAQDTTLQAAAFVDGELGLEAQLAIEARLANEPALRRQIEETRELRGLLRESAVYHAAPAELRERMTALCAPASPSASSPQATPQPSLQASPRPQPQAPKAAHRWFAWRPLALSMSFAALLAIALNLAWLQNVQERQLGEDVLASHVRSTLGEHLVDVASSDHHTVKPFLSARLGFSPPVSELGLAGSVFLGGRVDYLDGRPVAALVYRQGQHIVNAFVWPGSSADSRPSFALQRGYRTAHWSARGMNHWVISDVNAEEFQAVVEAVQRSDAGR
ncbi:anti-sigma factor [soil metagenome]